MSRQARRERFLGQIAAAFANEWKAATLWWASVRFCASGCISIGFKHEHYLMNAYYIPTVYTHSCEYVRTFVHIDTHISMHSCSYICTQ